MPRRPAIPTLLSFAGTGLLFAAVFKALPAALGIAGFALLPVGGVAALRRSGVDRGALGKAEPPIFSSGAFSAPPPEVHVHHHGGDGGGGGLF